MSNGPTPAIEVGGLSVVAVGAFNPAIFHPRWLADKNLMPAAAVDEAIQEEFVAARELAVFTADWLKVQVTTDKAVFSTVDEGREFDLRDLAMGVLDLLPETPVSALGINADSHFRVESEERWHAFGDRFLPKDFWQALFEGDEWKRRADGQTVGMRTMVVEAYRNDVAGFVRTEVAPSVRLTPLGVYAGINAHFQLDVGDIRGNAFLAARTLEKEWDATRQLERDLIERIVEIA